jgi:glycosyltransferase involved in cell wall biosynthesis
MENPGKLKILHLIASPDIGGAERLLLTLCDNIDKKLYSIVMGMFTGNCAEEVPLWNEVQKSVIEIESVPFTHPFDPKQLLVIYSIIKKYKPHIIHTHGYKTNILGLIFSKLFNIRIISTFHGWLHTESKLTKILFRLNMRLLRYFDRVIAVSDQIKSGLIREGVSSNRISIIRNIPTPYSCDNLDRYKIIFDLGICNSSKIVGFIGRLEKVKGISQFIDAAICILQQTKEIYFIVVGDGSERSAMEEQVNRLGLQNNFRFLGFVDNPVGYFSILDLYVLSSLDEGIPLTLLEAMSLGVPVIATRVGGIPEVITDGFNGLLVSPNNIPELANAIMDAFNENGETQIISENARKTIDEDYSLTSWTLRIQDLYNSVYFRQ